MRALALTLFLMAGAAHAGCGQETAACKIADGTYHLVLPPNADGPLPTILLLHGYGGEGFGMIRNKMVQQMQDRGYAVIAPDGQPRDDGDGRSWDFHPDRPATRNEVAFLVAVADDASARFGLDRDQMLLAGFSIGGSMTSYVACAKPKAFAAYAPVAGSFWRPHPKACAGPVKLHHTHGKADRTVPLEGREIMPGFVQGNVFEAMQIWRDANNCPSAKPDSTDRLGIYTVESWAACGPGTVLHFALHKGGHSIPKGWATMAMNWFEVLP